jgi:hypothetical protein
VYSTFASCKQCEGWVCFAVPLRIAIPPYLTPHPQVYGCGLCCSSTVQKAIPLEKIQDVSLVRCPSERCSVGRVMSPLKSLLHPGNPSPFCSPAENGLSGQVSGASFKHMYALESVCLDVLHPPPSPHTSGAVDGGVWARRRTTSQLRQPA